MTDHSRSARHKKKKKVPAALIVLLVLIICIVLALSGFTKFFNYVRNYDKAFDPDSSERVEFTVPSGASTTVIAEMLEEEGLIKSAKIFKLKTRLLVYDGSYQSGTFDLSPSMTMPEIMTALQHAKTRDTKTFTIPEGYRLKQIGDLFEEQGIVSAEEFYAALEDEYDYWFLEGLSSDYPDSLESFSAHANRLEGFLFPDTYEIYADASAHDIINKMLGRFDEIFDSDMREQLKASSYSIKEIVTIASLIEEETRTAEERPLVASVIYNRLNIDMPLEFCSTILYSLGEHKSRILYADLEVDSPYNTYKHKGLTPGPISSPGRAALQAALYPEQSDYLFFVLKGDGSGTHNFSSSYSDFSHDKRDYLDAFQ